MEYFNFSKNVFKDYNEDVTYICEDFGFLLDGATGLFHEHYTDEKTDVVWLVKQWKEYLVEALKEDKPIFDILKSGVDIIVDKYKRITNNAKAIDFPSSTICLFRRKQGQVEFYVLCDSPILVQNRGGECIYMFDSRNMVNDNINISRTSMIAKEKGINFIDAVKKYPDCRNNGRHNKNTPGHYYVLSDDKNAVDAGLYYIMPENEISKIMLMSDGFAQVFDVVKFISKEKLLKKVNTLKDVEKLYEKLVRYQKKDSKLNKYNRFKIGDDTSVVFASFK